MPPINILAELIRRGTQDQGPDVENQVLAFTPNTLVATPTSLRTDRKIKTYTLMFRGRITNDSGALTLRTADALLGTQLYALFQQITIQGQHLSASAQTPIQVTGVEMAQFLSIVYPNYNPVFNVSQNGAAKVRGGALDVTNAHTNDVEFILPIPTFPPSISDADQPFYCLHGPDWQGNLFLSVLCGDGTCLATANPPSNAAFTAYGTGSGSPTITIFAERPLLGKDLMARIRPAITFRQEFTQQPTATVSGSGGTLAKLQNLVVGKDTTRLFLKTGVIASGLSSGNTAYGSLSDSIVTRTIPQVDNKPVRFLSAAFQDLAAQDYSSRSYGRVIPIGFKMIDFIFGTGTGPANPRAAYGSSTLDASRQYELDGDTTASSNQIAAVIQEMLLGQPAIKNNKGQWVPV